MRPWLVLALLLLIPTGALADVCLMVYSDSPVEYHYDPAEYYTVSFGHPLYDFAYDRGGEVLIDINDDQIALDVYQAPNLIGFVSDSSLQGYFLVESDFNLIVDGFNNAPITYTNILLVFDLFEPAGCVPNVTVDGNPVLYDAGLGYYYPIGDLDVTTPTADGNNYSDITVHTIHWDGCAGMRIYAFSDENANLNRDGGECFSAYSHDLTVPVVDTSWGLIKSSFGN